MFSITYLNPVDALAYVRWFLSVCSAPHTLEGLQAVAGDLSVFDLCSELLPGLVHKSFGGALAGSLAGSISDLHSLYGVGRCLRPRFSVVEFAVNHPYRLTAARSRLIGCLLDRPIPTPISQKVFS